MTLRRRTPLQQRTPLVRRGRLVARKPLERMAELKRSEPLAAVVPLKRSPMKKGRVVAKLTKEVRSALDERSGGICEMQTVDCVWAASDACHRIAEGMGGRHGEAAERNDRLSNVLAGCRRCHDWCHRNVAAAEREGWMLREGDDPAAEPVHYRRTSWRLLADDGTTELTSAPDGYVEPAVEGGHG